MQTLKIPKVYLVGAGPGSPDLITLRGRRILQQAEVVIYDYLVDKRILKEAPEDTELICCDKLGKDRYSDALLRQGFEGLSAKAERKSCSATADGFIIHQERVNNLIVKKAKQGKKVVRLKNGDVSIFSRLSQELEVLTKNKIDFEMVPGVTAASAASCYSGIPLTDRRFASSCVFVTGHEDPTKANSSLDWDSLSQVGTIALYMAVENLPGITRQLLGAGKNADTPVAIIQDTSQLTQEILTGTLKDIVAKARQHKVKPPAIIIIGEVVKLGKRFDWLKKTKKILFTGISGQRFFEKGTFFHLPLIKIEPLKDYQKFDRLLKNIAEYDWIVFTSRYGVIYFFQRLLRIGLDSRQLTKVKMATIGNSTRNQLLEFGLRADLVPQKECSRGLINEFKKLGLKDKRIFLPRSNLSDKGLVRGLEAQGAKVAAGVAYKNVLPRYLPDLNLEFFDEVMFTSPSTVRNFIKRYGELPENIKVSCIGAVTRKEAKKWNLID